MMRKVIGSVRKDFMALSSLLPLIAASRTTSTFGRIVVVPLVAAAFLNACATPTPPDTPAPAPVAAPAPAPAPLAVCDAVGAKFAVGQAYAPQVEAAARHRGSARTSRVIKPGQMVTADFDDTRLNFDVDKRGRITGVRCG